MGRQISWFLSGVYSAFDVSGRTTTLKRRSKKAGAYSRQVSTVSRDNIAKSSAKVGNAMRASAKKVC